MASGLRVNSRRLKDRFERECSFVTSLIASRGSRTTLNRLLVNLEETVHAIQEQHVKVLQTSQDGGDNDQEKYVKEVEDKHAELCQRSLKYIEERKEDPASCASSICSEHSQAAVGLKVKQLESAQLKERLALELKQKQLEVDIRMKESQDAVALAALKVDLTEGILSDRLQDFADEEPNSNAHHHVTPEAGPSGARIQFSHGEPRQLQSEAGHTGQVYQEPTTSQQATLYSRAHPLPPPTMPQQALPPVVPSLPPLQLPVFSGVTKEWPQWFALFCALVHNNPGLTCGHKMIYLQTSMSGAAKEIISGFLYDGIMYPDAIRALEDKFGRQEDIVRNALHEVFRCPVYNDTQSLERFQARLNCAVAVLQRYNYVYDLRSSENLRRAAEKLPGVMKRQWAAHSVSLDREARPGLIHFNNWLAEQVKISAQIDSISPQGRATSNQLSAVSRRETPQRAAWNTTAERDEAAEVVCSCCQAPHHLSSCPTFLGNSRDDRVRFVAGKKLCFMCLNSGHQARQCRESRPCEIEGCRMRHHHCLHGGLRIEGEKREPTNIEGRIITATSANSEKVLLQVVPVYLIGKNGRRRRVYALLDPGAQTSLCTTKALRGMGLVGESQRLKIRGVEGSGPAQVVTRYELDICPAQSSAPNSHIHVPEIFSVPNLDIKVPAISVSKRRHTWRHLEGLELPEMPGQGVDLLIGANVIEAIVQKEVRQGSPGQPVGIKTAFGWALAGAVSDLPLADDVCVLKLSVTDIDEELRNQVSSWWDTESFGSKYEGHSSISPEDKRAMGILESTTLACGDRYEAGLLWRNDEVSLGDNMATAVKRLVSLERRLKRDKDLAQEYDREMESLIENGYARKVETEETPIDSNKIWILPHHPVINPKKKKVRIVFDAAAKHRGISLNDELLTGPDLLQGLVNVLIRFREERFAIAGDIQNMFHQIRVREVDQSALRFIWRNWRTDEPFTTYQMTVHIFGARCSPAVANYVLLKTAEEYGGETQSEREAALAVSRHFYVDDFLKSESTVEAAINIRREVTALLKHGGFRVHKWAANDGEVLASIPSTERAGAGQHTEVPLYASSDQRTLGYIWSPYDDTLRLGFEVRPLQAPAATMRGVLSYISAIFDPLGLFAPFTINGRILMQNMCFHKCKWDEPLNESHRQVWEAWHNSSSELPAVRVSRCLKGEHQIGAVGRAELHVFCDASMKAFAAAAYVRLVADDGAISSSLVMSCSRLAPLRQLSVVRLELQAAVLAVRLAARVRRALTYRLHGTFFWSDSRVILHYLQNESRRFHVFVANRISEIQAESNSEEWRHIEGCQNPADICTRGCGLQPLASSDMWWKGPSFLREEQAEWPQTQRQHGNLSSSDVEVKSSLTTAVYASEVTADSLDSPNRYSTMLRYKRVVAWVLRFTHNVCFRINERREISSKSLQSGPLTSEEIIKAQVYIFRKCQERHFRPELLALNSSKCVSSTSRLRMLSPFVDAEGLLRVGGRTRYSTVPWYARNPLILPSKDHCTRLLIDEVHRANAHAGLECTFNHVRNQYWVIKGRAEVKSVISACLFCKRRRAKPRPPKMADLPKGRLDMTRPFNSCGIDYFGPIEVKRYRKVEKRYVMLVTCMATRAVHLEMSQSLNTDSFLLALRRFMARRGRPARIYSDNGTNFVGGEHELKRALDEWNQTKISDELSQHSIEWNFNPPSAPHMGGAWERLIATVKRSLRVVLGKLTLSDEVLSTVITEVEFLTNGRPITYVSSDARDFEALTPNHFLLGRVMGSLPPGVFAEKEIYTNKLWRQSQAIVNQYWRRWLKEYIPTLLAREKWFRETEALRVGDVVLIVDENQPRGYWPMGRIVEVHPGADGQVRVASVRAPSGTIYRRPAVKLCRLVEG